MSRRTALEQGRYAAWMADTQCGQFETCQTTQELRIRIKYARKLSLFIMWLLCAQLLASADPGFFLGERGQGRVHPDVY